MRRFGLGVFVLFAGVVAVAQEERIELYRSEVAVHPDGELRVRETIAVNVTGAAIQHGIYRDFPTNYKTKWYTRALTTFDVEEVTRDGAPEPYHTEAQQNGVRVYIGDKDKFVTPGRHEYSIAYRTRHQLAFWQDKDELYWNVTGNGWVFPIDAVEARIRLPRVVERHELELAGYTGPQGSQEQSYSVEMESLGDIVFRATRPLGAYEGLTVSVAFPKGLVVEPDPSEEIARWARDNDALRLCALGFVLTLMYFVGVWYMVGRDPAPGEFRARSEPPREYSPATVRYLTRMKYDNQVFAAALVSLAVKGYVMIQEDSGDFTVQLLKQPDDTLPPEEKVLLQKLLPNGGSIQLKQTNHKRVGAAVKAVHDKLRALYEKRYFMTNYGYFLPGALMALGTILIALAFAPNGAGGEVVFLGIWLTLWSIGCFSLGNAAVAAWRAAWGGVGRFINAVFHTAIATPFFAAEIFVIGLLFKGSAIWIVPFAVIMVSTNWLFYQLLKAPTRLGRKALDEIEGFRAYLIGGRGLPQTATMATPEPAAFNKFFPYAVALDLDSEWADRFTGVIGDGDADDEHMQSYRPYWYRGNQWDRRGMRSFSSSIAGSMASVIAASSSAPGSSSGRSSSGGGSSGGGGGGGGGGGW